MSRRPVRIILLIVGLLATAGLGYRAQQDELALASARLTAADVDRTAEETLRTIADLRSSIHAYVAPGQGIEYWSARAGNLLDTVHQQVLALDGPAAAAGVSLSESLDGLDQLVAAERRARGYVANGQALLAGDVIFLEVRDLLDAAAAQVASVRLAMAREAERTRAALRQEQAMLAAAALGTWFVIALLLLPRTSAQSPVIKAESPAAESPAPRAQGPSLTTLDLALDAPARKREPVEPVEPAKPVEPVEPAVAQVAEICTDLSALSDVGALTGALGRAADVLGATGVIVWVAANDGSHLSPVATHGYDARLMARIGTIPRDAVNLTAATFRDGAAHTSAAEGKSPAALAVALCGPSGPVGVFSAELKPGIQAGPTLVAWATIFAAQLATLAQPVPADAAATDTAWPQQAQA